MKASSFSVFAAVAAGLALSGCATGTTVTHYNSKGRIDYVEDPAGNRTWYEYDPETGEKMAEIDALNKATHYAYNERGQVTHTWGDVPYPVHYVYDSYGRMSEMYTYRNGTNWGSVSWPSESYLRVA